MSAGSAAALSAPPARRRAPSLTPMIDVVFLLLVFFMLAARFGTEDALRLPLAGQGGDWPGAPRLVEATPDALRLNGVPVELEALGAALSPLMTTPEDPVVLRGRDGADLQRLLDVAGAIRAAGPAALLLAE